MLVVGMFLIVLQYCLMFLLKEHFALTVTFSLTRNMAEICFPVSLLLVFKELNTRKPSCKVVISSYVGFNSKMFLCCTVLVFTNDKRHLMAVMRSL